MKTRKSPNLLPVSRDFRLFSLPWFSLLYFSDIFFRGHLFVIGKDAAVVYNVAQSFKQKWSPVNASDKKKVTMAAQDQNMTAQLQIPVSGGVDRLITVWEFKEEIYVRTEERSF